MNATLSRIADVTLLDRQTDIEDDLYATAPVLVIKPLFQVANEEELHTSFEEAISNRLSAMNGRLGRLSDPYLTVSARNYKTESSARIVWTSEAAPIAVAHRLAGKVQRPLLYSCLALMFTLFGFDLMGLLMLHVH